VYQPALGNDSARVWYFWVGTDDSINYEWSPVSPDGSLNFGNKSTLGEKSTAPIGAMYDPSTAKIVIAWGGTDSNNFINTASIPNPFENFLNDKQTLQDRTFARIVLHRDGFFFLGFSGFADQCDVAHGVCNANANVACNTFLDCAVLDGFLSLMTADPDQDNTNLADNLGQAFARSTYSEQTSDSGYDIATYRNREYVTYTGTNGAHNVYVTQLSIGGIVSYSLPACDMAYGSGACLSYVEGVTQVSSGGHNWLCTTADCRNCATDPRCAPGGVGCPFSDGAVWMDEGACKNPPGPACAPPYATGSCPSYTPGTQVSNGGHNWVCDGACANCSIYAQCAPGAAGCPWGAVWTDQGSCTPPAPPPPPPPSCAPLYSQADCTSYTMGTVIQSDAHNWLCSNPQCVNCEGYPSCAPGGTGCPWGVVWTDQGRCAQINQ
jgi:hypothetical protein